MQNRRLPTKAHSSLTEIAIIVFAIFSHLISKYYLVAAYV